MRHTPRVLPTHLAAIVAAIFFTISSMFMLSSCTYSEKAAADPGNTIAQQESPRPSKPSIELEEMLALIERAHSFDGEMPRHIAVINMSSQPGAAAMATALMQPMIASKNKFWYSSDDSQSTKFAEWSNSFLIVPQDDMSFIANESEFDKILQDSSIIKENSNCIVLIIGNDGLIDRLKEHRDSFGLEYL